MTGGKARTLSSETGDTLIEVIISALLLGLVVVGTLTGINSANRVTSLGRERSQADALAQQDEDRLRSLPVSKLTELSETHEPVLREVNAGGTTFKVVSNAKYIVDNTATTNCSSTTLSAEYIQTATTVTWHALGTGKPVVETGIVSPPPGTSLIAQVTGPLGEGVPGMEVHLTGPSNGLGVTSTNGCAVLAVSPGEYTINVNQPGYVDQNWIAESTEDPFYEKKVYLTAETTTKKQYLFGLAAELKSLTFEELNPTTGTHEPAKAVNAILEKTEMSPTFRLLEPEGSSAYVSSITTAKHIYPFKAPYTVYAGSCQANRPPEEMEIEGKKVKERTEVSFSPGKATPAQLVLPSLIVYVWPGTKTETEKEKTPKLIASAPEVFLSDADGKGCDATYHQQESVAPTKNGGALKYPGQPWGTYTACINVTYSGKKESYLSGTTKNNNPKKEGTVVNLYEGGPEGKELEAAPCP